jgi:hypothetical protein
VSGEYDCAELMGSTQFLVYCRGTAVLSERWCILERIFKPNDSK